MNANNKKFGLGRGLESLLGDEDLSLDDADVKTIDSVLENTVFKESENVLSTDIISPCPFQPRTEFDEEALTSLSQSIKEKGILQPILVRPKGGRYEIVAGERRWRAAQKAGLYQVPVIIKDFDDRETLEIALIENLQRESLSAIDEAEGLTKLLDEYTYTQDTLGKVIGKSRSYISNSVRLLSLPDEIKQFVRENKLSAGHARALVGCPQAIELAKKIISRGLSVREVEKIVSDIKSGKTIQRQPKFIDADLKDIMATLETKLNLKVKINASQNGKGSVVLKYNNPAELSTILDILEQR